MTGRRVRRDPQRVPGWARVVLALLLGVSAGVAVLATLVAVRGGPPQGRMAPVAAAPAAPAATDPPPRPLRAVRPTGRPESTSAWAREVLRRWDADRAAAWRSGDRAALARLYTTGSVAGRRDVAALAAWQRRGLRVTRLETQVLALRVGRADHGRLVLRVTDRVVRFDVGAVGDPGRRRTGVLPRDGPTTRRLVLVLGPSERSGPWRMASVVDV